MMRKILILFLAIWAGPALANFTGKDASGTTVTFFNGTDCTSGTCVPVAALVNAAGATLYGTAGTANAGVLTIQGVASMTPVQVSQATAASLNATVVGTGTFATQAAQSGTWNITNVSGTVSLPTGAATSANQSTEITALNSIVTNTGAAIPAGSSIIGKVGIDQTTPITTNGVMIAPASASSAALSHASTTALGTSLVAKASAGNLYGINCTGITGGAAGYCIVYNGTTAPGTGALTGANVLDFCYFDTTPRGCSIGRSPMPINYSTGIVVLVSSAASPYTYTTGTDTAAVTADYQ